VESSVKKLAQKKLLGEYHLGIALGNQYCLTSTDPLPFLSLAQIAVV